MPREYVEIDVALQYLRMDKFGNRPTEQGQYVVFCSTNGLERRAGGDVASARTSGLPLFRVVGDEGWKCPVEGRGDPFEIVTEINSLP